MERGGGREEGVERGGCGEMRDGESREWRGGGGERRCGREFGERRGEEQGWG